MANKNLSKKDIENYIGLYYTENYLYDVIGVNANKRGYLQFPEFFEICMWKSSRPKKRYIKNKNAIENVTKKAFAENNEVNKIQLLCSLEGVGIPTASALLSVVIPNKYPVIDIRCLEQLNTLGYKISTHISVNVWIKYLEIMRELGNKFGKTPREMDMALFAMHRETLNANGFHNLYSKER